MHFARTGDGQQQVRNAGLKQEDGRAKGKRRRKEANKREKGIKKKTMHVHACMQYADSER